MTYLGRQSRVMIHAEVLPDEQVACLRGSRRPSPNVERRKTLWTSMP